jgi:hypothetical protein
MGAARRVEQGPIARVRPGRERSGGGGCTPCSRRLKTSLSTAPLLLAALALGVAAACRNDRAVEGAESAAALPATTPGSAEGAQGAPLAVARRLKRAPADCTGPPPRLRSFGDYGNLAGRVPVWAGLYASFDPTGQRYKIEPGAPRTQYGWRIKVLWVVSSTLPQPARVSGREVNTRAPLRFDVGGDAIKPTINGILDPAQPALPSTGSGYAEFPSYVYVPRAGCYELQADWSEGRWKLVFGLGR